MELRNLKTFLTVARLLNFRKSAEILNYAQSTVSAQIKNLEDELGKALFQRKGKIIELTDSGKDLLKYAQKIVAVEKEAVTKVSMTTEPRGHLSLRVPQTLATYFLPAILQTFYQCYPCTDLDISSCEYQNLPYELKSGITDLAFLLADSVDLSGLKSEFLGTVKLTMVGALNHTLVRQEKVSIFDLANQIIFLPKHDCSYKMLFEQWLLQAKVQTTSIVEMNSIEAIKQCVAKGIGVTIMPDISAAKEFKEGSLHRINFEDGTMETAVLMITHRGKWLSPILKTFMEETRNYFAVHPSI